MRNLMTAAAIFLALAQTPHASAAAASQKEALRGAKQYGSPDRGKELVSMWCVGCHSAGPSADDRIPSLMALAMSPTRTDRAVRTFLMRPHKPMPPLELSTQQIEDILAYLRTLSPAPAPPR